MVKWILKQKTEDFNMTKTTGKKYLTFVIGGTVGFATVAFIKWSVIPIGIWAASSAVIGSALSNYHKSVHADELMKEFAEWVASKAQRNVGV
jgi:mannose/fructose/N-acetylgalactosamine-specific phosphotransferase system component IIC